MLTGQVGGNAYIHFQFHLRASNLLAAWCKRIPSRSSSSFWCERADCDKASGLAPQLLPDDGSVQT